MLHGSSGLTIWISDCCILILTDWLPAEKLGAFSFPDEESCYNTCMAKTVIWDFNGTIIDDTDVCLEIENRMLKERNMKYGYTLEEYRDMFCFPVETYYRKLGYTFEEESYEELSVIFNDMYDQAFPEAGLCEGFEDLISESLRCGYNNVILSATEQQKLLKQCGMLGISQYFSEILGIDNLLAGGKTGMASRWMKQSHICPEDCLYIGDSTHDLDTAKALDIPECILVASGHQSYEVLKQSWDHVVRSLKEISL